MHKAVRTHAQIALRTQNRMSCEDKELGGLGLLKMDDMSMLRMLEFFMKEWRSKSEIGEILFAALNHIKREIGMKTSRIRLYFIYASFLTFGSPVIIYLIMAFILDQKDFLKPRKSNIWDL